MEVRTIDGVDFLFVEAGGYGSIDAAAVKPAGPQWHPGYQVYIRNGGVRK
jgi:hypothetical protein